MISVNINYIYIKYAKYNVCLGQIDSLVTTDASNVENKRLSPKLRPIIINIIFCKF